MTKIAKVGLTVWMSSSILLAGASEMKLYDVKSGKIEYSIKGSGEIMGQKMKTSGKKRVIFDAYGAQNLSEENKIDQQTIMGEKKTTKTHTMTFMKEGMLYHVNFKSKRIMRMENMAAVMGGLMGSGKNMKQTGEAMMKSMGGQKTGTDKVLGYTCDIWDLMGTKQCIYKGIPLRIESNIMGIRNTEVATKAEFDISLSKDNFKMPDFPIYDMQGNKLDKNKLDAMDKQAGVEVKKESEESAQAMKGIGEGLAAVVKAGYDPKSGKDMTPVQKEAMKKVMMNAMGGKDKMLARVKREILEDANSEKMAFSKACFGSANTRKEANACVDKGNKMFNDDEEHMQSWTAEDKKEMMQDMKNFERAIPCIEAAQTMNAMRQCMPQE